jgi:hypothetical protein
LPTSAGLTKRTTPYGAELPIAEGGGIAVDAFSAAMVSA